MSPDGKYVAAAGASADQSDIYIWNVATGKLWKTLKLPAGGEAVPLDFTSGDKDLVAVSYVASSKTVNTLYVVILSTRKYTPVKPFLSSQDWDVSGDGSTLAFKNASATGIKVTTLSDGSVTLFPLKIPASDWVPFSLQLDNSGEELIVSDKKGTAYVMDGYTGISSTVHFDYTGPNGSLPMLSPDGSTVLTPAADGGWQLWSVGTPGSPLSNITPKDSHWPKDNAGALYSSDGGTILTFTDRGVTNDLWSEATHALIASFLIPKSQDEPAVFLGPGGRQLVVAVAFGIHAYTELYVYDTP